MNFSRFKLSEGWLLEIEACKAFYDNFTPGLTDKYGIKDSCLRPELL